MKIRIEGEHSSLKQIHQHIYLADSTILVNEDNKETFGMQREPVVTALIVAVTPIVIEAIRAWVKDRKDKRDAELRKLTIDSYKEKSQMAYDLEKTKLILEQENKRLIEITAEEIDELEKFIPH